MQLGAFEPQAARICSALHQAASGCAPLDSLRRVARELHFPPRLRDLGRPIVCLEQCTGARERFRRPSRGYMASVAQQDAAQPPAASQQQGG